MFQGISEAFAFAGAKAIIITARKVETLKETEANIKSANRNVEVLSLALELTDESSIKAALEAAKAKFGKVDVLVNNAGMFGSANTSVASEDIGSWWKDLVSDTDWTPDPFTPSTDSHILVHINAH